MQVIGVFVASLKLVWEVGSAFAILGFLAAIFIQDVELRVNLKTKFGHNNGKNPSSSRETSNIRSSTKV